MNKALNNILVSSVLIVPLASLMPIKGTIVWYPQLLALMALGLICTAMLVWDMNKFISLFLIYTTFSYLAVCSQSPRSMLCVITGFAGILFAYCVSKADVSKMYTALIAITIINLGFILLQIFNIGFIFQPDSNAFLDRVVGVFGSRNQLGIFLASVSTILMTYSPWFVLMGLPILIIKGSSALVGLLSGIISILFFKGHYQIAGIALVILIIGSVAWVKFGNKSNEIKERFNIWGLTISQANEGKIVLDDEKTVIKSNPWFGFGIGNFFVFSPHSQQKTVFGTSRHRYEHAHNDIVEALLELGRSGVALILLCAYKVISDFITCLRINGFDTRKLIYTFSALVTITVCSMGVYVFQAPASLFIFCLLLGLFYREVNYAKQGTVT